MAREGLSASISIKGLYPTLVALRNMPDDAKKELKDVSFELSQKMARTIRINARAQSRQAPLMADTVTTGSNTGADSDLPIVSAGGSGKVGRNRKPAYKLLFGSEFGAIKLTQFKPRNPTGYWFFRSVNEMSEEISAKWSEAADIVIAKFSEGG